MSDTTGEAISILVCPACGMLDPGPREFCPACQHSGLIAKSVEGFGELVSWTMIRRPPTAFKEEGEYAVAVVALDAGVQVTGRLAHDHGDEPVPGTRVAAVAKKDGIAVFAAVA